MMKDRMTFSMPLVFFVFLLAACAAVEYQTPVLSGPKRFVDKHYELNKQQKAYAGNKMMEAKEYWALYTIHQQMRVMNDFKIEGPGVKHAGSKGDLYDIVLSTEVNLQMSYFIEIPGVFPRYGIGEEGQWLNAYFLEGRTHKANTPIKPEDTVFERVENTEMNRIDPSKPYNHFEIIFTGKTQDAINLQYREYGTDSVDRPTFQRNMSYPIDTAIIRFNQIRIRVHEVSPESITYTILQDGFNS